MKRLWRWLRGLDIWPDEWSTMRTTGVAGFVRGMDVQIGRTQAKIWWVEGDEVTVAISYGEAIHRLIDTALDAVDVEQTRDA